MLGYVSHTDQARGPPIIAQSRASPPSVEGQTRQCDSSTYVAGLTLSIPAAAGYVNTTGEKFTTGFKVVPLVKKKTIDFQIVQTVSELSNEIVFGCCIFSFSVCFP